MNLPPLDCHAHVALTVTEKQLALLRPAVVFAMTRQPSEALEATRRYDSDIIWACGAHPSYVAKGGEVDIDQFSRRVRRFAMVGEVGLDRRSGNLERQSKVFNEILRCVSDEPVLVSVHSAGCSREVIEAIRHRPHPGTIMHWFNGSTTEAHELVALDVFFSVNTAMRRELLELLPKNRILPETDFPVARKRTGAKPGDTTGVEEVLAEIHGVDRSAMRRVFYQNLRRVATRSGALDRFPSSLSERVMLA